LIASARSSTFEKKSKSSSLLSLPAQFCSGVAASFTITARDSAGNRRTSGGDTFLIALDGKTIGSNCARLHMNIDPATMVNNLFVLINA
jgi:hypothetical protein